MKPWEMELLDKTREFVAKVCPNLASDQRVRVVDKIYEQMRRTLLVVGHQ